MLSHIMRMITRGTFLVNKLKMFLKRLFGSKTPDLPYAITSEKVVVKEDIHSLSQKVNEIIQRSVRFLDVHEKSKNIQLDLRGLLVKGKKDYADQFTEKIKSLESTLKEREKNIEKIREKLEILNKREPYLTIPAIFLQNQGVSYH